MAKVSVRMVGATLTVHLLEDNHAFVRVIYASENLEAFEDKERFRKMTTDEIIEYCENSGWNHDDWRSRPLDWAGLHEIERLASLAADL